MVIFYMKFYSQIIHWDKYSVITNAGEYDTFHIDL